MKTLPRPVLDQLPLLDELLQTTIDVVGERRSLDELLPHLRRLALSDELPRMISHCVGELVGCPEADRAFMGQDHLVLHQSFGGPLVLVGTTQYSDHLPLYSVTAPAVIGAISPAGFSYRVHELPEGWRVDQFDPALRLQPAQTRHCPLGESLVLSTDMVYDYATTGDLVIKIVGPEHAPMMWEFDRKSFAAVRVYGSTLESSTLCYLLRFLGEHGNTASVEAVASLLRHPFHFVRWEAVKALGQLDGDVLPPVLRDMLHDPHPQIRFAAEKTLQDLES